jgi:hypothetical protein
MERQPPAGIMDRGRLGHEAGGNARSISVTDRFLAGFFLQRNVWFGKEEYRGNDQP